jgi:hypothetical protein
MAGTSPAMTLEPPFQYPVIGAENRAGRADRASIHI